jgi:hypothetical protein
MRKGARYPGWQRKCVGLDPTYTACGQGMKTGTVFKSGTVCPHIGYTFIQLVSIRMITFAPYRIQDENRLVKIRMFYAAVRYHNIPAGGVEMEKENVSEKKSL